MARFYIEHCVTVYHADYFEADGLEEAREMRDHLVSDYYTHLDKEFEAKGVKADYDMDYVDLGELNWDYDGPVMGKQEFCEKYTSLC